MKTEINKRYYFECEKGRRRSEVNEFGRLQSHDGNICSFSGCLPDHKIKLIKITDNALNNTEGHNWFKSYDKWENTPVYKSLLKE